jgi:hypothetical protein
MLPEVSHAQGFSFMAASTLGRAQGLVDRVLGASGLLTPLSRSGLEALAGAQVAAGHVSAMAGDRRLSGCCLCSLWTKLSASSSARELQSSLYQEGRL